VKRGEKKKKERKGRRKEWDEERENKKVSFFEVQANNTSFDRKWIDFLMKLH